MRLGFIFLFLTLAASAFGGEIIKIGLYHHHNVKGLNVTILDGGYDVYADDALIGSFQKNDKISVSYHAGKIQLNSFKLNISSTSRLELISTSGASLLQTTPKKKTIIRKVPGHLLFWNRGKSMSIVNTQDLDAYIAGVVEAESGSKQNMEYYKVQAVICRTYALANKFKHAKSGFHLCDEVHCQVYKGIPSSNPLITEATQATNDVVVVDQDIELITTAFHSNCGGKTINSEDVWSSAVPYLKAVTDTFCVNMPHSTWNKTVPKVNWMGFFKQHQLEATDSLECFSSNDRITHCGANLHLKDVRSKFGLNSTLFDVQTSGNEVRISGKGFGHGVGLCQEGAMKMSTLGYDYIEILHHYFTDIHVVPLSNFHLFREN